MLIPMYLGRMMMPDQMKMDLLKMLGTMMLPISGMTYGFGLVIHAMMSVMFALVHVAFFFWFDLESSLALWGLLFGTVHWMMIGIAFGMMKSSVHRGIRDGAVQAPGFFGLSMGVTTAMGILMVHLLYGVLVGVFYESFA
ncbi:MAG: hypothetical protein O6922_01470 [Chloroflexi bacterium]|nr:hypothetical protein [Chloroflexota bacterium]